MRVSDTPASSALVDLDRALLDPQRLGMLQRHEVEGLLQRRERLVCAGRRAFHAQLYGLGVAGEGLRCPAPDVAAKLVVQQDQREPAFRFFRPAVQRAFGGPIYQRPEFLADQRIKTGISAEPAVHAAVDGRLVHGPVTEPEVEYAADIWVAHRPEYRRGDARLLQAEFLFDRLAADREDGVLVLRWPEFWP